MHLGRLPRSEECLEDQNSEPALSVQNGAHAQWASRRTRTRVDALLKELEGKDIAEVIAAGVSKLASVPAGGGGAAMASSGGAHCSALPPGHPAQGVEECIAACMRCPSTGLGRRIQKPYKVMVSSKEPARGGTAIASTGGARCPPSRRAPSTGLGAILGHSK